MKLLLTFFALATLAFGATADPAGGANSDSRYLKNFDRLSAQDEFLKGYQEGRDLIAREEWGKAAEKFEAMTKKYPGHAQTDALLYWLAYAYKKQNKLEESNAALSRLAKEYPSSTWVGDGMVLGLEISKAAGGGGGFKAPSMAAAAPLLNGQTLFGTVAPTQIYSQNTGFATTVDSYNSLSALYAVNRPPLDADSEIKLAALQSLLASDAKKALVSAGELLRADSKATPRMKENVVLLLGRSGGAVAIPLIIETARQETNSQVRKMAITVLGGMTSENVADFLLKQYDAEKDATVKEEMISALSRHKTALPKLLEISRAEENPRLRRVAIYRLSRIGGEQVVDNFVQLYDRESSQEIKGEILSALGHSKNQRAVRKLIQVARAEQSAPLKIKAINALGGSTDPEAISFLQEVIK